MPTLRHAENPARRFFVCLVATMLVLVLPVRASAYLDLSAARIDHLDNGLTLIVLENHELPIVSVQVLYRVGARNETAGATGLAHFLEHMAFRSTRNFPDTQVVSSIYAAGGEWHGYTWLDQTTYFETAPREQMDLLLRIESDRMARLDIPEADVLAERGAVLSEMHGYENDPASVLQDNVMYQVFLAHPYRNNTIGWDSDVSHITHAQLLDFYRQHYQPGNAVLAIVGDVQPHEVRKKVQQYFGAIPGRPATPPPHTVEPEQKGERRITLQGDTQRKYFMTAYRAPAVRNPDYAAFLLAQELLSGGSGVSFLQDDGGTPVRAGAPLAGIADDLTTWFPPSDQDYVFTISGSVPRGAKESEIEGAVESGILALAERLSHPDDGMAAELHQAKTRVLRALTFDVLTTEDAAHQLAFFAGLDALDVLHALPQSIEQLRAADVGRVLKQYLRSSKKTVGWHVPASAPLDSAIAPAPEDTAATRSADAAAIPAVAPGDEHGAMKPAKTSGDSQQVETSLLFTRLDQGVPVILRRSTLSATVNLKIITAPAAFPAQIPARPNQPAWGTTSVDFELMPDELAAAMEQASAAMRAAAPPPPPEEPGEGDPAGFLERYFQDILGLKAAAPKAPGAPALIIVAGDIGPGRVLPLLERNFGDLEPAILDAEKLPAGQTGMVLEATLARRFAQEQLGYVVPAPGPGEAGAAAWQMALYILAHGYEGRLGKSAISQRGLVYYIDTAYHSDGRNGWITLSTGVDPEKMPAMYQLLRQELRGLGTHPPTAREVDEARQHLLGRYLSGAQSNAELADSLALQWLWYGKPVSYEDLRQALAGVGRQDVIALLPALTAGSIVSIRNPHPEAASGETGNP